MTISVRQETNAFLSVAGTTLTITPTSAYLAGSSLHLVVTCNSGNTITLTGDGVNTFVSFGSSLTASGVKIQHWSADNVAASAPTITITNDGSSTQWEAYLAEVSGTIGTDVGLLNSATGVGSGTDAINSGNITPTAAPGLLHAICVNNNSGGFAAGTGFTAGLNVSDKASGGTAITENKRYTSTAALAATWSCNQANNTPLFALATFKEGDTLIGQAIL